MKTKQDIVNELKKSGARYVKTSISNESCAVAIAINDLEGMDADQEELDSFEWVECSTGLDEEDY